MEKTRKNIEDLLALSCDTKHLVSFQSIGDVFLQYNRLEAELIPNCDDANGKSLCIKQEVQPLVSLTLNIYGPAMQITRKNYFGPIHYRLPLNFIYHASHLHCFLTFPS